MNIVFITMNIGANIKKLREQRGLLQKQVAAEVGIGYSNYNKLENGGREGSIQELDKLAKLFEITVDQIIHLDDSTPQEITIQDKSNVEKIDLINQLDEDEKDVIFKMIDAFLTKKKFKEFFEQQLAS